MEATIKAAVKRKRRMATKKVLGIIMSIDNDVCREMGQPHGSDPSHAAQEAHYRDWLKQVSDKIRERCEPADIAQPVLDVLEDENYHDAMQAAMIVKGTTTLETVVKQYPHL